MIMNSSAVRTAFHQARKPHRSRVRITGAEKPLDYVVMVYYKPNLAAWESPDGRGIAGPVNFSKDLKALAPETRGSKVAFFVQGYEPIGQRGWRASRYVIHQGTLAYETTHVRGDKTVFDDPDHPARVVGHEPARRGDVNLFEQATFQDFLLSAVRKFPSARHYVLCVKAHGMGFLGIQGEAVIEGKIAPIREKMPLSEFRKSLEEMEKATGKRFSLIDFNACLMGQFEVLSQLDGIVPTVVASAENEYHHVGSPHSDEQAMIPTFRALLQNSGMSPEEFGKLLVRNTGRQATYEGPLGETSDVPTLGLFSLTKLSPLARLMNRLGERLVEAMETPALADGVMSSARESFPYSFNSELKDLTSFLDRLQANGVLQAAGLEHLQEEIRRATEDLTVESFKGKFLMNDYSRLGALSVFVPHMDASSAERREALEEATKRWSELETLPPGWARFVSRLLKGCSYGRPGQRQRFPRRFSERPGTHS